MRRALRGAAALLLSAQVAAADCAADRIEFRTDAGTVGFTVEVAADEPSRSRGLMFRETMPKEAGMVFVYPDAAERAFWMKNTPLPLDIIFLSKRGVICGMAESTVPFSLDHIRSGCDAQLVLEVNAGVAAETGLKRGAVARRAEFLDPAWPCE